MATVTVFRFASVAGADEALATIQQLQKQQLIRLHDAAVVSWPVGRRTPSSRQLGNVVTVGALGGMFWGLLFGLIFFSPLLGIAVGAPAGALGGSFHDYGIDDDFIRQVRGAITEGTSALFLMTSDAVLDSLVDAMKGQRYDIIAANLSTDQERQLRETFVHAV
jgi:uncharacterized membrane protein